MTASPRGRIGGIETCLPERLGLVAAAYDPTPRGITSLRHEGGRKLGDDRKHRARVAGVAGRGRDEDAL
jgi:hypothetical protein